MSTDHSHSHSHAEALASSDPTRTTTLRQKYAQRLRGAFAGINTEIRRGIIESDVFSLTDVEVLKERYESALDDVLWEKNSPFPTDLDWLEYLEQERDFRERVWKRRKREEQADALAEPVPPFQFTRDDQKAEAFMRWLRRQQENDVLTVIERNENTFVRSAYGRGLEHAHSELRKEGVDVEVEDLENVYNLPVHQETLQMLHTRNYEALQGITDEVSKQIADELTTGFSQGWNPREMARNITDRVDKIGKVRASTLARTETINAHAEATLSRFEQLGVDGVTIRAEWSTAGDRRVCPICRTLQGNVYTIEEARTETFQYSASDDEPSSLSGTYPVKPPAHPNCRCAVIPNIS